jgi:DNA ligase-1
MKPRHHSLRLLLVVVALLTLTSAVVPGVSQAQDHDLMLPKVYHAQINIRGWWMSEKLDGVRAYWDGEALYSKNGVHFSPPPEFTVGLPPFPLEGELWGGRGTFARTVSIVLRHQGHPGWLELKYAIFDVPDAPGSFRMRLQKAANWVARHHPPYAFLIPQTPVEDPAHLSRHLDEVVAHGAEGLIVRDPKGEYLPGRSATILKVKRFEDAEATVVEHIPGHGRNQGRLGALRVLTPEGAEFKIGTGFTDAERENPPPLGAVVTYKFTGYYKSGIPRFPVYLRMRVDSGL